MLIKSLVYIFDLIEVNPEPIDLQIFFCKASS